MTEFVFNDPNEPSPDLSIPKLRWPFEMNVLNRGAKIVAQDSLQEVAQCVYAVLATEPGSRIEEPTFGFADQSFRTGGVDLDELRGAVAGWEDRAELLTDAQLERLVQTVKVVVT